MPQLGLIVSAGLILPGSLNLLSGTWMVSLWALMPVASSKYLSSTCSLSCSKVSRLSWMACPPTHFVEKPNRVPLALRLVVDFSHLNACRIRNQAGEETCQQLGED